MPPSLRAILQLHLNIPLDFMTLNRERHSDDHNQTFFTGHYCTGQRSEFAQTRSSVARVKGQKKPKEHRFVADNNEHHHFLTPQRTRSSSWEKVRSLPLICFRKKNSRNKRAGLLYTEWEHWVKEIPGMGDIREIIIRKYGEIYGILGFGAFGVVLLSHKVQPSQPAINQFYALKVLRHRPLQTEADYLARVKSEFSIGSLLYHRNIARIFELLPVGNGVLCECMEYYDGGDLHSLVHNSGQLEEGEANCFFKQLMRGICYLHEMGVAHRDLKPENLLLSKHGCLKISDFGNAECFRLAWEDEVHMSTRRCGSIPYISPEQYLGGEFDPRAVDIWAAALVYVVMRTGRILWKVAIYKDECFREYAENCKTGRNSSAIEEICHVRLSISFHSIL